MSVCTKSRLDPNQIIQSEHDETSMAKRVKITDTELSMELDADDGDSVQTQSRAFSFELEFGQEYNIETISKVRAYCKTNTAGSHPQLTIEVSPLDEGDFWVNSTISLTPSPSASSTKMSNEVAVTARRMRLTNDLPIDVIIVAKG